MEPQEGSFIDGYVSSGECLGHRAELTRAVTSRGQFLQKPCLSRNRHPPRPDAQLPS